MNLAVLGTDLDALALVAAALEFDHHIVWLGEVRPDDAADVATLLPRLQHRTDWELLLDQATADAVIIGAGTASSEMRAEQLKRLATDAVPMLVVHPAAATMLVYYEVDMARRESRAVVRHYTPLAGAPAIALLTAWVESGAGAIGDVHQVVCDRHLVDCGRTAVLRTLARDAEILRAIAGGIRTVNAVGPKPEDELFASLQVQMTTPRPTTIRWAVTPALDGVPRAGLTLIGSQGIARLRMPADDGTTFAGEFDDAWQLEVVAGDHTDAHPITTWNAPRVAIDALAAALPANGTEQSTAASTWSAATAAMEVVDAIELSLHKGRTIEVHQQQLTEQLAFRGTMAAFGCGLLFLGFFAIIAAGLFGDVLGIPLRSIWPWLLFLLLAFFLLLQTVPWLASKRKQTGEPNES